MSLMEETNKIIEEDEGINQEIIHPKKYKVRRHDAEWVGVKLDKMDPEKAGHLDIEAGDRE